MLDHKVSPLLDAMEVGECFAQHDGASCYWIRHPESGREFVLKHISVPATEGQVEALLLTGAYSNEEEADAYYRKVAEGLVQEAENRKRLLDCPYILPFLGVQMEKKEGVGYEIYAVLPKRNSLETYLSENAVSHLRGLNMGIDLCVALSALREEGYVHGNLKPGNVFFSDTGRFLLGDFGLISTEDMQYAVLPEQYRSCFSAPELSSMLGGLNTTVDIYSLGMILYRIYNGNHAPFEDEQTSPRDADAKRVLGEALPAPIYADYELAGIICKACAYRPEDRYQTPDEMRIELEQYMRRNAVNDHLIVPPLVKDDAPLSPEAAAEEAEPVRFADPDNMDDTFKKTFSPAEGRKDGREKPEKKPEQTPASKPEPQAGADRGNGQRGKTPKRKKHGVAIFALAMLLLVLGICLYEFTDLGKGKWHYFVSVRELEVSDVTADSLRVRIDTDADPADFTVICQDAYGNKMTGGFRDGVADFQNLTPNTQYSLQVEIAGLHKLSGVTDTTASTKALTEITSFLALPAPGVGSVRLELTVRDEATTPAFWTLQYGRQGQTPTTVQFAGSSCTVSELEKNATYRFTLVQTDNLYLSGQTEVEFTPTEPVEASELRLESIQDGAARLSWLCATDLPDHWELSCTDPEGTALAVSYLQPEAEDGAWRCAATVSGLVRDTDYAVSLSAPGLAEPLSLQLRDAGVTLSAFTAEAVEGGLDLAWIADREPAAGWRITAAFGENMKLETEVRGERCTMAVLPETDYTLTITPADGSSMVGDNVLTVRSGSDRRFAQMGVNHQLTIGLYDRPDKEDYRYEDLNLTGNIRFHSTSRICFAVVTGGSPIDSDETVTVQYVVRDGKTGEPCSVFQEQVPWNSLWDGKHFVGDLRQDWLPSVPGGYSFAVYVNSQRMGSINFTLLG